MTQIRERAEPATLTLAHEGDVRVFDLRCAHQRVIEMADGDVTLPDVVIIQRVLAHHFLQKGCPCTRALWARYGPHLGGDEHDAETSATSTPADHGGG